jgi:hypothetical protein
VIRYRTWLKIFFATAIAIPILAVAVDILLQRGLGLRQVPLDPDMEKKVYSLIVAPKASPAVIVAGDSRAERHVDPAVIESRLKTSAVNVAVSSGEMISVAKTFDRYDILAAKPVLILSATSFQYNNGAIDHDSLSMDSVVEMPWIQQVLVVREKLPEMAYRKIRMYWDLGKKKKLLKDYPEKGFVGVDTILSATVDQLSTIGLEQGKTRHPWYKDLRPGEPKATILADAIDRLAQSGCPIILFTPPVSPVFREYIKGTWIDQYEREYSAFLQRVADRHPNIHFLDFYQNWTDEFPNDQFYDIQHLNRTGAQKLTAILCDRITEWGLLKSN